MGRLAAVAVLLLVANAGLGAAYYPDVAGGTSAALLALAVSLSMERKPDIPWQAWAAATAISAAVVVLARDTAWQRCGAFHPIPLLHLLWFNVALMSLVPALVVLRRQRWPLTVALALYLAATCVVTCGLYSSRPHNCASEARLLHLPVRVRVPGRDEYEPPPRGDWSAMHAGVDSRKLPKRTFHYLVGGAEAESTVLGPRDVCAGFDLDAMVRTRDGTAVPGLIRVEGDGAAGDGFSAGDEVRILPAPPRVEAKGRAAVPVTFVYEGEELEDASERIAPYVGKPFFVQGVVSGRVVLKNGRGRRVKLSFRQPASSAATGDFHLMEVRDGRATFGRGFPLEAYEKFDRLAVSPGDTVHVTAANKLRLPSGRTYTAPGEPFKDHLRQRASVDGEGKVLGVRLEENAIDVAAEGAAATATVRYYGQTEETSFPLLEPVAGRVSGRVEGIYGGCVKVGGSVLQQRASETRRYEVPVEPPDCDPACRADRHFVFAD